MNKFIFLRIKGGKASSCTSFEIPAIFVFKLGGKNVLTSKLMCDEAILSFKHRKSDIQQKYRTSFKRLESLFNENAQD